MKLFLIVAKGRHQGMPIQIKADLFIMGSDPACQLRSQLPGIGSQHCAIITRDQKKVFVQDMDSGEITLVNNELLPPGEKWPLHAGDRLSLGALEFMIQFNEKQLSQRDLEEWALKCLDVSAEKEESEFDDGPFARKLKPTTASAAAASILDKLQERRGIVKGRLRVGIEAGVTIIRFNDVYLTDGSELALIRKELNDNTNRNNLRVLLDMKNVKRMSSAGAEMIVDYHRWLRQFGSTLAICRIKSEFRSIFKTLHVFDQIEYFKDKPSALLARW